MKSLTLPKLTFWRVVVTLIFGAGLYATFLRFFQGFQASTNLTDPVPWGLWVGLNTLCGVGLSAGGFAIAAAVYILGLERYRPVLRASILLSFLGYVTVISGMMYELGLPWRIWHPMVMWNFQSVLFDVAWCVMLYTTVLALEFAPVVLQKFGLRTPIRLLRAISIPLMIAGVILSTLHQSSLGSLYLIVPHKLHPLWYSPVLPLLFYISAICVGFAMTIFESWHSSKAFGRQLELPLLASMGRVLAVLLTFYFTVRFVDLYRRGVLHYMLENRLESWLFGLEIALMLLPMLLLFRVRIRWSPGALYACAVMVILGFVAHRLNVSTTGMEMGSGTQYVPRWSEVVITLWIIAVGFAVFRFVTKYFPVFEGAHPPSARGGVAAHHMPAPGD